MYLQAAEYLSVSCNSNNEHRLHVFPYAALVDCASDGRTLFVVMYGLNPYSQNTFLSIAMLNNARFSMTSFIFLFFIPRANQAECYHLVVLCFYTLMFSCFFSLSTHIDHIDHILSQLKKTFLWLFHRSAAIRLCYITCSMLLTSVSARSTR